MAKTVNKLVHGQKAAAIRSLLKDMPGATSKDIAAAFLERMGTKVSENYVSMIRQTEAAKVTAVSHVPSNGHPQLVYASKTAVDIVLATRELANKVGGYAELRKLIEAME